MVGLSYRGNLRLKPDGFASMVTSPGSVRRPKYALFDIGKSRAILFGPSPYSGVLPGGGAGNGLQ